MNLVDRYVYDVTRRLPAKQRDDVRKELQAEIEAMIDDEANGKKPSKKHVYDVLLRMGDPAKLADQYTERQLYIISPAYYHAYIQLIKTLLAIVLPIIIFFTFTGSLATVKEHFIVLFFQALGVGFEVGVHIAFWVTVSFVLVERFSNMKQPEPETWTPDQLPKLPGGQQISKSDAMMGIAWSIIAIWATAMQIPQIHAMMGSSVPLFFSPEMWPYWTLSLLAISVISLGAEIMKFIVGGWTLAMMIVGNIVNLIAIGYFIGVVTFVSPVVNPAFTELVSRLLGHQDVARSTDFSVKIFVAVVVLISAYEIFEATKSYITSKKEERK